MTYKHRKYELPHEPPCQNKIFVNTRRKLLKNMNLTFPVVRYLTQKLELAQDIPRAIVALCNMDKYSTSIFQCYFTCLKSLEIN